LFGIVVIGTRLLEVRINLHASNAHYNRAHIYRKDL
jgi:hypothetical protein